MRLDYQHARRRHELQGSTGLAVGLMLYAIALLVIGGLSAVVLVSQLSSFDASEAAAYLTAGMIPPALGVVLLVASSACLRGHGTGEYVAAAWAGGLLTLGLTWAAAGIGRLIEDGLHVGRIDQNVVAAILVVAAVAGAGPGLMLAEFVRWRRQGSPTSPAVGLAACAVAGAAGLFAAASIIFAAMLTPSMMTAEIVGPGAIGVSVWLGVTVAAALSPVLVCLRRPRAAAACLLAVVLVLLVVSLWDVRVLPSRGDPAAQVVRQVVARSAVAAVPAAVAVVALVRPHELVRGQRCVG